MLCLWKHSWLSNQAMDQTMKNWTPEVVPKQVFRPSPKDVWNACRLKLFTKGNLNFQCCFGRKTFSKWSVSSLFPKIRNIGQQKTCILFVFSKDHKRVERTPCRDCIVFYLFLINVIMLQSLLVRYPNGLNRLTIKCRSM